MTERSTTQTKLRLEHEAWMRAERYTPCPVPIVTGEQCLGWVREGREACWIHQASLARRADGPPPAALEVTEAPVFASEDDDPKRRTA
jgi:hypothetical protein